MIFDLHKLKPGTAIKVRKAQDSLSILRDRLTDAVFDSFDKNTGGVIVRYGNGATENFPDTANIELLDTRKE